MRANDAASRPRHFHQVLFGRPDFDEAALLQFQPIAGVQHDGLDQVEQEIEPAIAQHAQAPR